MPYALPAHVATAGLDDPQIRYVWDDSRVDDDFTRSADDAVDKLLLCSPRAQIVAGIGIYEWILWRFHRLSDDPLPFHLGEAAWCASIDARYMRYIELSRSEWLGPVRGPLWCAVTWLIPMLLLGKEQPDEYESGLRFLSRLALHVLPPDPVFGYWLDQVADRLLQCHPAQPVDPFSDLFDPDDTALLGPPIPREILEPQSGCAPELTPARLSHQLREADRDGNPLLRSPAEVAALGFEGRPYAYPTAEERDE